MTFPLRKDGAKLDGGAAIRAHLDALPDGRYDVEITKATRTSRANAYLWGCVYAHIAGHLGYTVEEIHDAMKQKFRSRECLATGLIIIRSTKTDSDDFWEYVTQVREWSATFLGMRIPDPNEHEEAA